MLRADSALVDDLHPSPNIGPRRGVTGPDMLLLHYTGMPACDRAIDWLSRPESQVSCHYVIDCDGRVTQMVAEAQRAWHAGVSYWAGETDINSCSIGFEIHNRGHNDGYPDFPDAQMRAVIALAKDCIDRWGIRASRVLAHSDVAPERKDDPGEKFDWSRLAASGVGHWVTPTPLDCEDGADVDGRGASPDRVAETQSLLAAYGYNVPRTGYLDAATTKVVTAFQRHFRPARVDGCIDASTLLTLRRLLKALPAAAAADVWHVANCTPVLSPLQATGAPMAAGPRDRLPCRHYSGIARYAYRANNLAIFDNGVAAAENDGAAGAGQTIEQGRIVP
ncbi:MAG: N-acetylmuramoyl-L-alanine amidase [Hyphomicrobiaceae bacterium]